jgi:hypothetical protein
MAMRRLGMLNPSKTLFLLCDVQEKFRFMNQFADFAKNVNKLVRLLCKYFGYLWIIKNFWVAGKLQ